MSANEQVDVTLCPFCEEEGIESHGSYDGRVLIGGRGVYRCEQNREHRWQDAHEKPSTKGAAILPPTQ